MRRMLRIAVLATSCGLLYAAGPGGKDVKGGLGVEQYAAPQEEGMVPEDHPHPDEVSEGQWMFWAAIAAGAFACIAAGIKIYPAIRKRRKKG